MPKPDSREERNEEVLIELLAAKEHERWSHWQTYLHGQCEVQEDGSLLIPTELATRWQRQAETAYDKLSDSEKESDREQVRKYLPTVKKYFGHIKAD